MKSRQLTFDFQSRYFTLGNQDTPEHVWLVCHGYGQLASYFIQKFQCLDDGKTLVVAPEGLSRFYLGSEYQRIGASWMTRENRLVDIRNYLEYLKAVFKASISPVLHNGAILTLFGFSQGVSTICRFADQELNDFHRLILWAGTIPPDMNFERAEPKFKKARVDVVYGDKDPYVNPEHLQIEKQAYQKLGITPNVKVFSGSHQIVDNILLELALPPTEQSDRQ